MRQIIRQNLDKTQMNSIISHTLDLPTYYIDNEFCTGSCVLKDCSYWNVGNGGFSWQDDVVCNSGPEIAGGRVSRDVLK